MERNRLVALQGAPNSSRASQRLPRERTLRAGEAGERPLGADAAEVLAPHAVVGELLLGPQRRRDRAALRLELLVGDPGLDLGGQHVARAAAVAELRLVAPQQLVG